MLYFDLELTGFQMSEIDIILDSGADKTKRNREESQDDAPEHKPGQPVTRNSGSSRFSALTGCFVATLVTIVPIRICRPR